MDNRLTSLALALSIIALAISIYAVTKSDGSVDPGAIDAKIEEGIDAFVKKQQVNQPAPSAPSAQPAPTVVEGDLIDDDAVKGDKNAPVTIVEFSDYECPYCKRHFTNTIPEIIEKYVDTGKVKYVYRDFPLSFHANARPAAIAAECAREQGGDEAYFAYHDVLFQNQQALDADNLKKYASDLGYDIADCLVSEKYGDEVDADMEAGKKAGVRGTPASFVNGILVSGAQPFSAFETAIEAELNK
jgi:protein-disulfide isomerase